MKLLHQMKSDRAFFAGLGVIVLCILLTGCVPSLHSLWSPETGVFNEELIGVWKEKPDQQESWMFQKDETNSYLVTIQEDESVCSRLKGRLVKLGDTLFLDLSPDGETVQKAKLGNWFSASLIPGHLVAKVEIGSTLQISILNHDWLKQLLRAEPTALDHSFIEDDYFVITAKTPELQKFVRKHAHTEDAWEKASPLRKQIF